MRSGQKTWSPPRSTRWRTRSAPSPGVVFPGWRCRSTCPPVVKFYGVTDGRFFNWYGSEAGFAGARPAIDENRLKALAFEAAAILGLEVFGGDVAFPEPDRPVLIDINDWPSFAPFREDAARAIADYITHRFAHRKYS